MGAACSNVMTFALNYLGRFHNKKEQAAAPSVNVPPSDRSSAAPNGFQKSLTRPLHFLPVFYDDCKLIAMIDSGAEVNVIGQDLVNRLGCLQMKLGNLRLHGCGGVSLTSKWVKLWLRLTNGQACMVTAVVSPEFGTALILGSPFLHDVEANIDFGSGLISTKFGAMPCVSARSLGDSNSAFLAQVSVSKEEDVEVLNELLGKSNLSGNERERVKDLLCEFSSLWAGNPRGATNVLRHQIRLSNVRPIRQKPRRFTPEQNKIIDDEVKKMLSAGVIRPSQSPYAHEVVLVKKKTGDWRFCIDFRRLNDMTIADEHPLPRIQDLVRSIRNSKYFVALDLRSGYWQVLMEDNSIPFTAFRSHLGLYEFTVMPFGLKTAPATFSRLMDKVIGDMYWDGVCVYLDDVLIYGETFGEVLTKLREVLTRLRAAGLTLALNKSEFFPHRLLYLGYIIEDGMLKPNPARVEALNKIKAPTNVSEVRSLLGCFGYLRQFIPKYAQLSEPINQLLRKGTKFRWTEVHERAKANMIKALTGAVLSNPIEGDLLKLETDASDTAIGAALYCRRTKEDPWQPIEFLSKNLNEVQRRWPVHEKEGFAIIHSLEKFDAYLRGRRFEVYTDNASLKWMKASKTGKVARWASRMAEYDMDIIYRPGKTNLCADFLSRFIENEPDEFLPNRATVWTVTTSIPKISEIVEAQKKESPPKTRSITTIKGTIYHGQKLWVPPSMRIPVIERFHNLALYYHPGVKRTVGMIRKVFSWSGIQVDVARYVRSCLECQRLRPGLEGLQGFLTAHPVGGPFTRVHIDIYEVTIDGVHYNCLTMIDNHTKWVEVCVLPSKTAKSITDAFIKCWICRFGCPQVLISDNDKAMSGSVARQVCQTLGVRKLESTACHPDGNAPIESFHRVLSRGIQRFMVTSSSNQLDFDQVVQLILFGYRLSMHSTTKETPAYLTFGFDPRPTKAMPYLRNQPDNRQRIGILNSLRENIIQKAYIKSIQLRQRSQMERLPTTLQVGDLVLLPINRAEAMYHATEHHGRKVMPKFTMPFRIIHVFNNGRSAKCKSLVPLSHLSVEIREASVQDIRQIYPPLTQQQLEQWQRILENYLSENLLDVSVRDKLIKEFWEEIWEPQVEEPPKKRKRRV